VAIPFALHEKKSSLQKNHAVMAHFCHNHRVTASVAMCGHMTTGSFFGRSWADAVAALSMAYI